MISTKHNFIIVFLMAYFMFNQNIYYSDGDVTAPERNGYFYQIKNYEQFTEYAKKADYAVLFFNYDYEYYLSQETAFYLQNNKRLIENRDVQIFEVIMEELHDIEDEYNVRSAPYLISLRKGSEVGRLKPPLAACYSCITKVFKNIQVGHVTVPTLKGNFHKILMIEQFKEYTLKDPHSILFFNYPYMDEICKATIQSLNHEMKKPEYKSAVKIYEVDNYDITNQIKYIEEIPYLISLRKGNIVEELIPSKAPNPLSLDSFFSNLVGTGSKSELFLYRSLSLSSYFTRIYTYEQYTTYAKNANYAILFFTNDNRNDLSQQAARSLQNNKRLVYNRDVQVFEVIMEISPKIADEYNVNLAPYLISLRKGSEVRRLIPSLASCSKSVETLFQTLIDGHVTVPILEAYSYKIEIYRQYTEYTLKEPYAILFFNYLHDDEICSTTIDELMKQLKKTENNAVKIYEVDIHNEIAINIISRSGLTVNEAPYLISFRTGTIVEKMIPSKAPSPLSLDSFFSNLVRK